MRQHHPQEGPSADEGVVAFQEWLPPHEKLRRWKDRILAVVVDLPPALPASRGRCWQNLLPRHRGHLCCIVRPTCFVCTRVFMASSWYHTDFGSVLNVLLRAAWPYLFVIRSKEKKDTKCGRERIGRRTIPREKRERRRRRRRRRRSRCLYGVRNDSKKFGIWNPWNLWNPTFLFGGILAPKCRHSLRQFDWVW